MKNAVNPKKKHCGALLVGLVFFLLFMSCGYVALAYGGGTGEELLLHGAPENNALISLCVIEDGHMDFAHTVHDEAALLDYVSGLALCRLTGNYSFPAQAGQRGYNFTFATQAGVEHISLRGNVARLTPLYEKRLASWSYYIPGGIDEAYLDTLFS